MTIKTVFTAEIKHDEKDDVIKVEKWDWNAVKNALDDATRKFITSQKGFKEDHSLLNMRLLISTVAILISLYGIYDDWVHPFPASKQVLIICVIAYFATLTILTLYTAFVEKGVFTAAKQFDETGLSKPNKWKFTSKQKEKQDDYYSLEVEMIDGDNGNVYRKVHNQSVARYFDEEGHLCFKPFYADLCKFLSSVTNDEKKKN